MNAQDVRGIGWIDALSQRIGHAIAWLTLAMIAVSFVVVVLRYGLDRGFLWMQESVTWMHAVVFMLGASYALRSGDHVRVDVIYKRLPGRQQARIDLGGSILFLAPVCLYLLFESWPYVSRSWAIGEKSREAGGLPAIYLLKTVLIVMPALLLLQGMSEAVRAWRRLRGAAGGG